MGTVGTYFVRKKWENKPESSSPFNSTKKNPSPRCCSQCQRKQIMQRSAGRYSSASTRKRVPGTCSYVTYHQYLNLETSQWISKYVYQWIPVVPARGGAENALRVSGLYTERHFHLQSLHAPCASQARARVLCATVAHCNSEPIFGGGGGEQQQQQQQQQQLAAAKVVVARAPQSYYYFGAFAATK